MIRLGESIPQIGRVLGPVLGNVLDEGFEEALDRSTALPGVAIPSGGIVSVGSLTTYRGLATLLDGYSRYRSVGGSLPMTIIGSGKPGVQLTKSLPPGVVVLREFVSRDSVLATFREASISVFPSSVELSPLGLLEAEALCRVVIASDIEGHRQAANAVRRFRVGDSVALGECLLQAELAIEALPPDPGSSESVASRRQDRIDWCASLSLQLKSSVDVVSAL